MLAFFVVGVAGSLLTQIYSYKTTGVIYEKELYSTPMAWGAILFFLSLFLSERKSAKAKSVGTFLYNICILIVGIVTASFLFLVTTGR